MYSLGISFSFSNCIQLFLVMTMLKATLSLESSFNSTPISSNCSTDLFKCLRNLMPRQLSIESKSCVGHQYFDDSRGQCVDCSTDCPANSRLDHHCNRTHDIQCVCNLGFFLTTDSGCKPCAQCESGWGIWRTCRGWRNTVCRKCPPGTFSGAQTGTLGCILCTKCNSSQVLLKECSGVHDSICVDRRTLESMAYGSEELDALPLFIALLIVVIIVLIVYVIIQLRIKRFMKSTPNTNTKTDLNHPNQKPSISYHNLYNKSIYTQKPYNYYSNQLTKSTKLSDNHNEDNQKPKRYNEMNTCLRRSFEITLNKQSDSWKKLAKELGYSSESIGRLECLGRQHMNSVQYFLTDWSRRESATVGPLLRALIRIGRIDCVLIIDPKFQTFAYN